VAFAFAGLMAGWWYVGTCRATRTLSGEQIAAAAAHFGREDGDSEIQRHLKIKMLEEITA